MNKWIVFFVVVGLAAAMYFGIFSEDDSGLSVVPSDSVGLVEDSDVGDEVHTEDANFTASFEIYTKGTKRIFTAAMYHNLSDDVYIEASDPSVIHVERDGVTWGEFFGTLPFSLSEECLATGTGQEFCDGDGGELKFFLNGEGVSGVLGREIGEGDELQVIFE